MADKPLRKNKRFNYDAVLGENNPLLRFPLLFEEALNEFSEKLFREASLNDILKKANMSKSSLYYHFGDKFGLYLCLMDIIVKKKLDYFIPRMKQLNKEHSFFDIIKKLSQDTICFMLKDKRIHSLSTKLLGEDEILIKHIYEFFPYDYNAGFGPLIESAKATGQIDKSYSTEFLTKLISILFSNMYELLPTGKPEEVYPTVTRVFDILENGVKPIEIKEKKQ